MEGGNSVYEVDDTASSLAGGDPSGVPTVPRGQVRKVKNTKSGQEEDKIVLKLRACISCRLIMSEQQVVDSLFVVSFLSFKDRVGLFSSSASSVGQHPTFRHVEATHLFL